MFPCPTEKNTLSTAGKTARVFEGPLHIRFSLNHWRSEITVLHI